MLLTTEHQILLSFDICGINFSYPFRSSLTSGENLKKKKTKNLKREWLQETGTHWAMFSKAQDPGSGWNQLLASEQSAHAD